METPYPALLTRRRLTLAALLVCGIIIVVLAARYALAGFQWDRFSAALAAIDPLWATASLLLMLGTYLGRALRWQVMLYPIKPDANLRTLISATVVGFTAIVFFGRPGEFVRPWLISVRERVSLSSQLATWFLERIFDLLCVVLLFGFALSTVGNGATVPLRMQPILHAGGYFALTVGLLCVAILVISARFSDAAHRWSQQISARLPIRLGGLLQTASSSLLNGMKSTGSPRLMAQIAAYTAVEWALITGSMHSLFKAFGPTASFAFTDTLVFTGFIAFGGAVQLPGIGGGMQVAAILVLTELFSLSGENATACALLVWISTWLSVVPFGLFFAFTEGLHWSSLRNIKSAKGAAGTTN
ncbi:MAG: flippase-like domain-containing protein [Bryobacteraceae bacterium]|nr:flippase-like domain-containing protein [Bryobacteraceae bacterium]